MINKLEKKWGRLFIVQICLLISLLPALSQNSSKMDEKAADKTLVATPEEGAKPKEMGYIVREIEIRFDGTKTTNDNVILANLRTKVGEPYTYAQSEDDVRSLYATGLFSSVKIFQEHVKDGLKIVVLVKGKTKLKEVVFEGNQKYKNDRLKKEVKIKSGDVLSEQQVSDDANSLVEFYQKGGFQAVKVAFEIVPDELTGQSVVKFIITEGTKIKIQQVNFEGNKIFKTSVLRKKIETQKYNWWLSWMTKSGFLKETQVEEDKQRLINFYRSEGYIDADIKDVKYDYPTQEAMIITFFVFEGNPYKVGKFTVEGNHLFSTEEIEKILTMKAGDIFIPKGVEKDKPKGLEKDIKDIRDMYGVRGYVDADVKAKRAPNVSTGTMDVSLEIREGDQAYIDLINIQGNVKTKDKVIRRELAVAPGDIYNTVKVDASKKRLEQTGFFSHISAESEETDVPNRKNLIIAVEEQRTGHLNFGAGFSSVDSILGFVEVGQGNFDIAKPPYFTGAGQKAKLRAQFGARRQDYVASFTEPWFLNQELSLGGDIFYNEAGYLSNLYNQRRYGFDIRTSKALDEQHFNRANLMYKFEQIELFDIDSTASPLIQLEKGSRTRSSLNGSLSRDTRDSLILPSRGYRLDLVGEVAGGPALGGETEIYKLEFDGQIHFTMPWWEKNILSFNGATGVVEQWNDGDRVPIFDKLFLGGPGSVRGFPHRDLGPKDSKGGESLGGKTMAYLQTEYSIPVIERVRFATWVDGGQVWEKAYDWGATSPSVGAGIGLRLNLPLGGPGVPINLDYGWPIRHDQFSDGSGQFSFSTTTQFGN